MINDLVALLHAFLGEEAQRLSRNSVRWPANHLHRMDSVRIRGLDGALANYVEPDTSEWSPELRDSP